MLHVDGDELLPGQNWKHNLEPASTNEETKAQEVRRRTANKNGTRKGEGKIK